MTPFYSQAQFWRQAPGCRVQEFSPPANLSPFIAKITRLTADVDLIKHRVPDGCFSLSIAFGPGGVPPRSYIYPPFPAWKWMQIRVGVSVLEARFRWGRGRQFLGVEPQVVGSCGMSAINVLPASWKAAMEEIEGKDADEQMSLFVSALEKLAPGARTIRPEMVAAFELLERYETDREVRELVSASCLSSSQLRRVMARDVGMPPTKLLRLARLWQAMSVAIDGSKATWGVIAAHCGYFDSAHLIDEFRYFAETSPTQWLANLKGLSEVP